MIDSVNASLSPLILLPNSYGQQYLIFQDIRMVILSQGFDKNPISCYIIVNRPAGGGMVRGNRKYERDIASLIIYYSLPIYAAEKPLTALMKDYSYSGLRMITTHPLEEGQEILINGSLSVNALTAVVRWSKRDGDTTFEIGLEFIK